MARPVSGIDAELVTEGTISGRVTGPDGEPVANVSVFAESESGSGGVDTTDADGRYQLYVLLGWHYISFSPISDSLHR